MAILEDIKKKLLKLGEKRLNLKKNRMKNLLKIAFPDEGLYREIMLSLGYKNNKVQFLELATITPYSEIRRLGDVQKIELALLHRAGFIDTQGKLENFDFSLKRKTILKTGQVISEKTKRWLIKQ